MEYPFTVVEFLTVGGVALFGSAVMQWLKLYVEEWRWTQVIVFLLCEGAALVTGCIKDNWMPTSETFYEAARIGFWGATLATFGYEAIQNWRGLLGAGPRQKPKGSGD